MKKINYYLAFNAALNDPEECEEIEEITIYHEMRKHDGLRKK